MGAYRKVDSYFYTLIILHFPLMFSKFVTTY